MIKVGSIVRVMATGEVGRVFSIRQTEEGDLRLIVEGDAKITACSVSEVEELNEQG